MIFHITLAGASIAYVGMLYGALRMMSQVTTLPGGLFALGVGALFGGGMALPFVATNFVAAWIAARAGASQGFGTQFGGYMLLSLLFGWWMLRFLDSGLRTVGGLRLDTQGMLWMAGMALAGHALAALMMATARTSA
jgi:hypothetical protein